ncbi:MAG: hypothetical protein IPO16_08910 [Saprospiraceae bacterium]|nr:hypothetical protein [Saprospiraceae bacterium]
MAGLHCGNNCGDRVGFNEQLNLTLSNPVVQKKFIVLSLEMKRFGMPMFDGVFGIPAKQGNPVIQFG